MPVHLTPAPDSGAAYQGRVPPAVGRRPNRKSGLGGPGVFLHGPGREGAALYRRAAFEGNRSRPALR